MSARSTRLPPRTSCGARREAARHGATGADRLRPDSAERIVALKKLVESANPMWRVRRGGAPETERHSRSQSSKTRSVQGVRVLSKTHSVPSVGLHGTEPEGEIALTAEPSMARRTRPPTRRLLDTSSRTTDRACSFAVALGHVAVVEPLALSRLGADRDARLPGGVAS